jgi:glycosyltransferase involved in cell wall biosynthesis
MNDTSRPTRIVRLITRLNIGGPSIQAAGLSRALDRFGYTTLLVHGALGEGEGDMRYLLDRSTEVECVPALVRPISLARDLRALRQIVSLLRRERPAILHTHMAKAGTLGRLAAFIYNGLPGHDPVRVVHTYHGHVLDGYFSAAATRVFIGAERALAHGSDAIVAISNQIRRELLETYRIGRPAQYHVIPLGFDLQPFAAVDDDARAAARATLGIAASAPVVTTVGRLTAIKQHDLFVEMAARVRAARPNTVFLIVGDGERRRDLERQARALGIADSTRFLGWRRDLPAVYAATDVFALTSRNEGTPVALIEAMASGVPGVATEVGGVPDVVARPDLGILVPYGDAAAMAFGVERLLQDPVRRRAMGAAGRESVLSRYAQERLVNDIVSLYQTLTRQS